MAQTIREVMTTDPTVVSADTPIADAARLMRDQDIGPVIVIEKDRVRGIVTDRDLVVRAVAEGRNPQTTRVAEICSGEVVSVAPDEPVDQAVELMRQKAIRRLPVVEDGHAVGIVSIGDLAVERDRKSALADISAAPPNH